MSSKEENKEKEFLTSKRPIPDGKELLKDNHKIK